MTQDEIIEIAKQTDKLSASRVDWDYEWVDIFANLVAAKEREACAKILEVTDLSGLKDNPSMQKWVAEMLLAYANAIRARGQA